MSRQRRDRASRFGSARFPTTILDSWTYLADRRKYALGKAYAELFCETLDLFAGTKFPAC